MDLALFIFPFTLIMLGYSFVMLKLLRDANLEAKLLFAGQVVSLIVAFIAFLTVLSPVSFGLEIGDGAELIRIGITGTGWALSLYYNVGIVLHLCKKKK